MGDVHELRKGPDRHLAGAAYAIVVEDFEHINALHLIGEFDLSAANELEAAVARLAQDANPIVIDMSACSYLDSTILGVLIRAAKKSPGRLSMIVPIDARIRRIFSVTKLDDVLPLDENLAEASERLAFN